MEGRVPSLWEARPRAERASGALTAGLGSPRGPQVVAAEDSLQCPRGLGDGGEERPWRSKGVDMRCGLLVWSEGGWVPLWEKDEGEAVATV